MSKYERKNSIGILVKNARQKQNISARELARLCSVSHTEINNIESGKRIRPSIFILKSFEKYLGLKFKELAREVGYSEKTISDSEKLFELYQFKKQFYRINKRRKE